MACTQPCSCCKGACCNGGTCSQETCEDCELGGGEYQGPATSCDGVTCSLPCTDCYKDCIATNDGDTLTTDCAASGGADPGYFWEWTESGIDYSVYLLYGRTFGDPALNCGSYYCATRAYDSVLSRERTFNWPVTPVYSADGCVESLTVGSGTEGDGSFSCVLSWLACDGVDCGDLTPPTPGPFEFSCSGVACADDTTCYGGYCVDGFCGPEAPPP
jgi:hypothetical protein